MNTCWRTVTTVAVAVILCSVNTSTSADKEAAVKVSVEDIGTKVLLIGRLGGPLGTMMDVKGTWVIPNEAKDNSPLFQVSHVNGKELPKPVGFYIAQVTAETKEGKSALPTSDERKKLDGVAWTMRAYETGEVHIVPKEYSKESGKGLRAVTVWTRPFTSHLVGLIQQ